MYHQIENSSFICINAFLLLCEQRYTVNGTLMAAQGGVTTSCNRLTIVRYIPVPQLYQACAKKTFPTFFSALLRLALHHHKRTLHGVQLRIPG